MAWPGSKLRPELGVRARVRVRDGEGDGEEQHHNVHKRACCGVVPRRRHHVPWGCREWIKEGGGRRAKGEGRRARRRRCRDRRGGRKGERDTQDEVERLRTR